MIVKNPNIRMRCKSFFEGHLRQKKQKINKRSNFLFVFAKSVDFAIIFLILPNLNFLDFENFWPSFGQIFDLNLLRR